MPDTTWYPNTTNENPYDQYLSNCENSLYCDISGLCVQRLKHGEVCASSNQCANMVCVNQTCQLGQHYYQSMTNTIHIAIYVVCVLLFIGAIIGIYFVSGYIKKRKMKQKGMDQLMSSKPEDQQQTVFNILDANFNSETTIHSQMSSTKSHPPPPPYFP